MKYVVLGSSAAGINAVHELRRLQPESEITLVSKDSAVYSRCILHHYLAGERTLERLNFDAPDFAEQYRVNWLRGREAAGLRPAQREVVLENGEAVPYDKLLIATGSHTFFPPVPGLQGAENVAGFRNIEDIDRLKEAAGTAKNVVVMGAGLVGMDCTTGFLALGIPVSVVEMADWMLVKQLDPRAAKTYQDAFAAKGVRQYYGCGIAECVRDGDRITEAVLTDGRRLPCDFLVVTAGVRANVAFLEGSGIETSRFGLVYDETGRTSDPDVYGAGDVSGTSPIWPAAVKEGIIAASSMAGVPRKLTDFFASKSTMNFLGIPTMSLGNVNPAEGTAAVEIRDTGETYKKIVHQDGKILGAVLQGDLAYGGVLQQLIARKIDISRVKKPVFDIDYSDFFHLRENFEFCYMG